MAERGITLDGYVVERFTLYQMSNLRALGITLDGYVVERFTLYQMSNLRALSKAFFILPYLNVVSWNIFQLGGPFWGLVVVKLSELVYATKKIPTHSRRKLTLPAEVQ